MFGLFFFNNKDLRRILSDYGFKNFPLRKDFPLKGFYELQYFDKEKRVSYISDQSSQQARIFSFKNP
jgi:NADH-quinone oxidoreductase subunit C